MSNFQLDKLRATHVGKGVIRIPAFPIPLPSCMSSEAMEWTRKIKIKMKTEQENKCDTVGYLSNKEQNISEMTNRHLNSTATKTQNIWKSGIETDKADEIRLDDIRALVCNPGKLGVDRCSKGIVLMISDEEHVTNVVTSATRLADFLNLDVILPEFDFYNECNVRIKIDYLTNLYSALIRKKPGLKVILVGEGNGAELCASLTVSVFQNDFEPPGAVGLIGISGVEGDSKYLNKLLDISRAERKNKLNASDLISAQKSTNQTDPYDPVLYPLNSNLKMFPPTILICGTRDYNYSGSLVYHRELKRANVEANLHIFEGMCSGFHQNLNFPETVDALQRLSDFISRALAGNSSTSTELGSV